MSKTDGKAAMTAPTPEQMRALAKRADDCGSVEASGLLDELADALRAAAEQIEAVQVQGDRWANRVAAVERVADMAQDDEHGNGWVPADPLLDALYPEKRGVL